MKKQCNGYKHNHKDVEAYMIGFLYLMILMLGIYDLQLFMTRPVMAQDQEIISPVATGSAQLKVASISAPLEVKPEYTREEIESYIKTIFRKDAKVAIAVSHNECGYTNKRYPKCNLHTNVENSVGLFQINIESATSKVHWARIPGDTLEEKKTWLEDPFNNTLMAYWIYTASGNSWNAWSAYTSGRYLRSM